MSYLSLIPAGVSMIGGIMGSNAQSQAASLQALMQQRQYEAQLRAQNEAGFKALAGRNTVDGLSYYDPATNQVRESLSAGGTIRKGMSDANTERALTTGAQRNERVASANEKDFETGRADANKFYQDLRTGYRPSDDYIAGQDTLANLQDGKEAMKAVGTQMLRSPAASNAGPLLELLRGVGNSGARSTIARGKLAGLGQGANIRNAMNASALSTAAGLTRREGPQGAVPTIGTPDIGGVSPVAASQAMRGVQGQTPLRQQPFQFGAAANGLSSMLQDFLASREAQPKVTPKGSGADWKYESGQGWE